MSWTEEQLAKHPKRESLLGIKPQQKASDADLIASYLETRSVWQTAQRFGMCGQSVWERLKRLNVPTSDDYTPEQEQNIRNFYAAGFAKGELDAFCSANGLLKTSVSRWAATQGMTNASRSCTEELNKQNSERGKAWLQQNPHPRGFLGHSHTSEARDKISSASQRASAERSPEDERARLKKILQTKAANGTLITPRKGSWKQGWYVIGARRIFLRSRWEVNYACYLEFLKSCNELIAWDYEIETFWFDKIKRGTNNYTPDFKVTKKDGGIEFHEVKGWMDPRSKTKLRRMKKYHPTVKIVLIDATWFKSHKSLAQSIPGWIPCRF